MDKATENCPYCQASKSVYQSGGTLSVEYECGTNLTKDHYCAPDDSAEWYRGKMCQRVCVLERALEILSAHCASFVFGSAPDAGPWVDKVKEVKHLAEKELEDV
jgi:hypothetical protein